MTKRDAFFLSVFLVVATLLFAPVLLRPEMTPGNFGDLFSYRIAMRCTSSDASDTILGQGWASRGYSAASINSGQRGVGYVLDRVGKTKPSKLAISSSE